MDRNLARSSNRLPGIRRRGALTDFTTRHGFARWEVIGRIGMIGGTQSNFGLRLRPCFANAFDGMRTPNFCRSAILGGGRNRRSGIITHRGTSGRIYFLGRNYLPFKIHKPTHLVRRFGPDTSSRAQTFQQSAIIDSQHSKPVIADFSLSKKGVDFMKKICAHTAPIHAIACTCNTRNYVHTFFRARGIN